PSSTEAVVTILATNRTPHTVFKYDCSPAVRTSVINDSSGSDATKTAGSFQLQVQTPTGGALTGGFFGSETGQLFQLPRGAGYNVDRKSAAEGKRTMPSSTASNRKTMDGGLTARTVS